MMGVIRYFPGSREAIPKTLRDRCIVMEKMDMDLEKYINDPEYCKALAFGDLIQIFVDVASGLVHMHLQNVIHRDLKPQNILLKIENSGLIVKLSDFGHSREYMEESWNLSTMKGTLAYMSPEVLNSFSVGRSNRVQIGFSTDIYSLGTTMLQSFGWYLPCGQGDNLRIPPDMSDLIDECRENDPSRRPTAEEVHKQLLEIVGAPMTSGDMP